ncbi:hypothetical protein MYCTH_2306367 [Thermothelomyces thermophilus ATCC 42464]|uniref:Uncharacterized protein n=1 Tax=Thermothelomyces thermophilus (strain ATCC 42464 / BCRC 31852 / DSM 1799) TaxID=573729 RepID=G2QHC7_THET4|nr:uncharacterized protein MYCTH_2306367 [Thermothelomyces thermophilus ATCC 42464]AEO58787.1 hypothetical protein MYCTH_2306367 [Thermothelomyces thermophilus ATCC 42464]
MPMSLEAPVLQVDANVIHKVDTTNPANLFSMWTVFARCRDSVAQGRRLENLSWRLWNRETFCCEGEEMLMSSCATSQPRDIQYPRETAVEDLPQLSGSVDSVADEEAVDLNAETTPVDIVRPRMQRQDSCASSRSRGKERHITSDELEKMVVSIMETKSPLSVPLPNLPRSLSTEENKTTKAEQSGSTNTDVRCETPQATSAQPAPAEQTAEPEQEAQPRTIVTRGFSPSQAPISRTTSLPTSKAPSPCAIPQPTDAPAPKVVLPKKQQAKFALGGSSGSDEESFKNRDVEPRGIAAQPRGKMFQLGGSSGEDSPRPAQQLERAVAADNGQKKVASFNNEVVTQTYTSSAISDTEDDYLDESAIDDDDEEWEEESAEESGSSMGEEKLQFRRIDSTANLPSRRSLITLMLAANNNRAQRLGNVASQSTSALPRTRASLNGPSLVASPNDSDEAPLMMKRGSSRAPPMRPINEIPRSGAQPSNVTATGMHHQAALSPRTTRRNMLATELTESLRRNLLRERSQKTSTANAVLKRRHTSTDVANLKQYPERPYMKKDKEVDTDPNSWDKYFQNPFAGYAQAW